MYDFSSSTEILLLAPGRGFAKKFPSLLYLKHHLFTVDKLISNALDTDT